jgi:SPP1 gp7 family putative phage head morphogenesis protein
MCKACGDKYHFSLALGKTLSDADIKRIAKLLHSGELQAGDIDKATVKKIANILMGGVFDGYGKSFKDSLTVQEFGTLKALERNVYVFSGFKNEKQLKETAQLLTDSDGNIRPFNDFLKDVETVSDTYNEAYLSAEYSNSIASAQAISFWEESERTKDTIKNLTWRTAGDANVRPEHAVLDGMTLPKDDPFWQSHFIPLDWGCRCDIEENNDEVTDIPEVLPKVPPMFQNNVGITGIIFPDTHPYFEDSKRQKEKVIEAVDTIIPKRKQ